MGASHSKFRLLIIVDLAGFRIDSDGGAVLGGGHSSGLVGENRGHVFMLVEPVVKGVDGGDGGCMAVVGSVHWM